MGELDSLLGLERLNAAHATIKAQAVAVLDKGAGRRLIDEMKREAR